MTRDLSGRSAYANQVVYDRDDERHHPRHDLYSDHEQHREYDHHHDEEEHPVLIVDTEPHSYTSRDGDEFIVADNHHSHHHHEGE